MEKLFLLLLSIFTIPAFAQNYWQQRSICQMDIDLDVTTHRLNGKQKLVYTNNSPEELNQVFYHLYFNAFQPNSEMDVRSRTLPDPDKRVGSRIFELKEDEQGFQKIISLKQDGKPVKFRVEGTILQVFLQQGIKPGKSAVFEMEFQAQVPVQIRRSGRDNTEGIDYSMTQWYPKMCEFDAQGWHTDPYIGREFYGVWGDFEVKITIDSAYTIGGTGYLQNAQQIGKGYETPGSSVKRPQGNKLTWHFSAPNVHDFAWAADPDFVHYSTPGPNGTVLHCIYQPDSMTSQFWPQLGGYMAKAMEVMNEHFGQYPYKQYTFIQGGDGGMEYPMTTLITGRRPLSSLVGVSVHEMNHSWFQGVLGFDESHYYWMDEGFTEYAGDVVMPRLFKGQTPFRGAYAGYLTIAGTEKEQPLSTHADWYANNGAYGIAAYNKGSVCLSQLRYIMGDSVFAGAMKTFFSEWKMKHPDLTAFKRVMEKASGMELDWYFEQFIGTTHTIDYGIKTAVVNGSNLTVSLQNLGKMPMPVEVAIVYANGRKELVYIPLSIMLGRKTDFSEARSLVNSIISEETKPWRWVDKEYVLTFPLKGQISKIIIDPFGWTADIDRGNNIAEF